MKRYSMAEVFSVPAFSKPRALHQIWLKDVGFDEAPKYSERMGLVELADFLEVAAARLDYVKIVTTQVLFSPADWLKRKIKTYQRFGIEPYLDHTYFMRAYRQGVVEKAIVAGSELGFRTIEFMNTGTDVGTEQGRAWRQLALDNDMRIIFEYHPPRNWDPNQPACASSSQEILKAAEPFLEAGSFAVMLDHEEFDLQGDRAVDEIGMVIEALGLETLVFEVTSPKEGPKNKWQRNLESYFKMFGPELNVANIMPSQAMFVESIRESASNT